jgi:molybdate/tungstate transport system permease protein
MKQLMPGRKRSLWFQVLLGVLGFCVLLFVLGPIVGMVTFTSPDELRSAATDSDVLQSIKVTLLTALAATVAAAIGGVPLAYLLARKRFFGRELVLAVVDLPIIIPHSAAGVALLTVIGRRSLVGGAIGGSLVDSFAGIALAMAFVSIPFLVNAAREAFEAVPVRLEQAAQALGASPGRVFFTISLPLAWRGVASGLILMWARGISEFGAVVVIAYHPMTTPVMVFQRLQDFGLAHARSVATLLVLVCVGIFVVLRLLARRPAWEVDRAGTA